MKFREIAAILKKHDWYEVRVNGSHHQFTHSNVRYVVTVVNHGSKDIAIGTVKQIEKSTGLSLLR